MKAVIQRVQSAEVIVENKKISSIQKGILTLLGIEKGDTEETLKKLIEKIIHLRIFEDENGKMNASLLDIKAEHLIVSQFTLCANTQSGRRPSFTHAENPALAKELYDKALLISSSLGVSTYGGIFQADMKITLTNDGPVTFIL
jgi:D-tyrosyl-tRNA(Tyr) deacylase